MISVSNFIDIGTIIISSFLFIFSLHKMKRGSRYVFYYLFFIFYVVPLYIDYLYKFPDSYLYGFRISSCDSQTRIIYDFGVLIGQIILLFLKTRSDTRPLYILSSKKPLFIIALGMLIPIFVAIFMVRNPLMLVMFQWRELHIFEADVPFYYILERWSYIGIACSILIILADSKFLKYPVLERVFAVFCLYMSICSQGKRAAFFFAIVIFTLVLLLKYKRYLIKARIPFFGLKSFAISTLFVTVVFLSIRLMFTFSLDVQTERDKADDVVNATRIDFFRDDRVRLAIYSSLNPNKLKILDHSEYTVFTEWRHCFVPFWFSTFLKIPKDPIIYQHYLTQGVEGATSINEDVHYMTVSYYAELISNFGVFLGLFLFPLLCVCIAKITDKFPYPLDALIISSFVLLNLFDVSYIIRFFEFTGVICLIYYRESHKIKFKKKYLY